MNTPPLHYPSTSSHRPYAFPIPSLYTRLPTPCRSYTDLIRSLYNALQALYSPYTVRISSHADPILSLYISYYALTEPMQTLYNPYTAPLPAYTVPMQARIKSKLEISMSSKVEIGFLEPNQIDIYMFEVAK